MKLSRTLALAAVLALTLCAGSRSASAAPAAPTLLGPANGASVTVPLTISWSAVSAPGGIAAYNWQVSPSASMSPVIKIGSTTTQTQDAVSGLANGTYFWRVDVYDGTATGPWSAVRSFTVTGATAGEPGSPTLNPIPFGAAFHPLESFPFSWTAVPGAATYTVDASTDPRFPLLTEIHSTNIPGTSYGLDMGQSLPQGTWYLRVSAVSATGVYGVPSNLRTFVLSWNAPLPPPPTLLTPANGATVALPVMLSWTAVPNPQNGLARISVGTSWPACRPLRDQDAASTVIGGPVAALRGPPANLSRTLCALTKSVPLGGAFWDAGTEVFINRGVNGRWAETLTPAEVTEYEARAVQELGAAGAHWLATGVGL